MIRAALSVKTGQNYVMGTMPLANKSKCWRGGVEPESGASSPENRYSLLVPDMAPPPPPPRTPTDSPRNPPAPDHVPCLPRVDDDGLRPSGQAERKAPGGRSPRRGRRPLGPWSEPGLA